MADWYRPQLASLVDVPPAGDQWLHEITFDGYRAGCRIADGQVTPSLVAQEAFTEGTPDGRRGTPRTRGSGRTDRRPTSSVKSSAPETGGTKLNRAR